MDYYSYISDNKIDMLLPQISNKDKKKFAAEIGVNIGVFKAGIKAERETETNANRVARLKAVSNYILKYERVGSIDVPDIWIHDTQSAKVVYLPENDHVVFFIGESENGTRFALGGSKAHLASRALTEKIDIGWSFLPDLLQSMGSMLSVSEDSNLPSKSAESFVQDEAKVNEFEWMEFINTALDISTEPTIKIKFLARRLLEGKHPNDNTPEVLATPLYVAMVD